MTTGAKTASGRKARAVASRARQRAASPGPMPAPAGGPEVVAVKRSPNAAIRAAAQIIEAQKMLLNAGLRVLRIEREPAAPAAPPAASMEEVFDRRVASALQRLGMPETVDLARLAERLDALERRLGAKPGKPRRKPAA
jgi:diacylglycerol kinase family enzyme